MAQSAQQASDEMAELLHENEERMGLLAEHAGGLEVYRKPNPAPSSRSESLTLPLNGLPWD